MADLELMDIVPGSPWLLAGVALLAVPGVRRELRPAAKAGMRAGLAVYERSRTFFAEAREQANDLMAEARQERENAAHERDSQEAQAAVSQ